ncbi:NAT1 [Branchiostoma lanceolatum]|uniref:arylamine N-acetyltransferase n=1 Tax=Branchiostoma lanceolatum TaxID=7740 RepID=A0A8J9YPI5_BRALA|nr:NAT1 [Branchiostoma lanceolatum]
MDVRQYLSRIGYHGDTSPTLDNLDAIHQAHVLAVPFENLSIHCGEEIILDLQLFYNTIVVKGRGGCCYENNGLLSWLLGQLGFNLKTVKAPVNNTGAHPINVVSIDEERWVVDVGFGCVFRTPIRLAAGHSEHLDVTGTYRLQQEGETWILERKSKTRLNPDANSFGATPGGIQMDNINVEPGEWVVLYKFTLQEHKLQDFSEIPTDIAVPHPYPITTEDIMDVRQYLSRISYHGDTSPTLENLGAIYQAHMLAVPFENLSIHCGEEIILDLQLFYNKIVLKGRGGFCYENNGLFSWLLGQLGFNLKIVKGQVGDTGAHMVNVVSIDGERWVADVGFGCVFRTPIRLAAGQEHPDVTGTYRLQQEGETWIVERKSKTRLDSAVFEATSGGTQKDDIGSGEWAVQYKFTLQEHQLQDFSEVCSWTQRESPFFIGRPWCVRHLADGLITYMGRKLITTRYYETHLTKTTTVLDSDDAILAILWDTFRIKLEKHLTVKG